MSENNWRFDTFTTRLNTKCESLRKDGFIVELDRHDSMRSSIRLRAERQNKVGELIVWDDGMASEAVIDLQSGDFIHMRDGTQLTSQWVSQLTEFLVLLGADGSF